jgi:hypothetical protein
VAALPASTGDIELAINDPFAARQALSFEILEVRRLWLSLTWSEPRTKMANLASKRTG